jgi:hypothetical protein
MDGKLCNSVATRADKDRRRGAFLENWRDCGGFPAAAQTFVSRRAAPPPVEERSWCRQHQREGRTARIKVCQKADFLQ